MMAKVRIVIALLFVAFSQYACDDAMPLPDKKFVAREWIKTPEEKRYVFASDILDSGMLIGMPLDKVKLLLGPPSSQNPEYDELDYILYYGDTHGFSFDVMYLLDIQYNKKTKIVEKAFIRGK